MTQQQHQGDEDRTIEPPPQFDIRGQPIRCCRCEKQGKKRNTRCRGNAGTNILLAVAACLEVAILFQQNRLLDKTVDLTDRQLTEMKASNAVTRESLIVATDSVKLARQEFEADQRPWLSVSAEKVRLSFNQTGATALVSFETRNAGRSPGVEAYVHAKIEAAHIGEEVDIGRMQAEFCDPIRQRNRGGSGFAVFPGSGMAQHETYTLDLETIERAKHCLDGSGKKLLFLWMFGCVDYKFPWADDHHQTGFFYMIQRPDPARPGEFIGIDPEVGVVDAVISKPAIGVGALAHPD